MNPGVPDNELLMLLRFIDGTAAYSISGQRMLNNVNRTHLVLVTRTTIYFFNKIANLDKGVRFQQSALTTTLSMLQEKIFKTTTKQKNVSSG